MPPAIRVAIIDDHAIVRAGLANFLKAFPDLEFVGEADSGESGLDLCRQVHPDVVLMDLMMPDMNGVEATRLIKAMHPQLQVVVLTSFNQDELVSEALQAGAIGYLLKNTSIHETARAIRLAYQGKTMLSPEAAQVLIQKNLGLVPESFGLKEREFEILTLMADGLTNPQIAEKLMLSLATIKFYVSAILEKLEVETRTEAVVKAIRHGLVATEKEH